MRSARDFRWLQAITRRTFTKSSQFPGKTAIMDKEIAKLMDHLGIRYDQAYRMVRQRREFERRGAVRSINMMK